ncbi:MAG: hypothetical protein D3910_26545 [Candidatus Electrothrix sp. ATG2]|nr:hypothetical protein [Candidatus Electrothrix sp. ATG2]
MVNVFRVALLAIVVLAIPVNSTAASSIFLFLPAILSSSLDESKNSAPEAFIESAEVKGGTITLQGYFKDDDDDPFISAIWILQNDKGITIYEFSGLEINQAEMTAKGEITIVFTVTTGVGNRQKTSVPVSTKINI